MIFAYIISKIESQKTKKRATADYERSAVAAAFLMLYQTERLEQLELLLKLWISNPQLTFWMLGVRGLMIIC